VSTNNQHAWGLGKSGRTVNRTCDAILTDQSPSVLAKRFSSVGEDIKECCSPNPALWERQQLTRIKE
jgi:hypothetical protein